MNTKYLDIAFSVVEKAGEIIKSNFSYNKEYQKKGTVNLLTETDKLCEEVIYNSINKAFPEHSILAEEGHSIDNEGDYKWIIDPLDGTTNFVHSLPFVATSIALEYKGNVILGVVNNPILNERYWAVKGNGAYLNDAKINVSNTSNIKDALIATGFPYNRDNVLDCLGKCVTKFLSECRDLRRCGSAAIDLCYVARGVFDGFYELQLNPWDVAAGMLIVNESGGEVLNIMGDEFDIYNANVIASNAIISKDIIRITRECIDFTN